MMEKILQYKTITFDSNGGTPVPPQTLLRNEKIIQPEAPILTGFLFYGWYKDNGTFRSKWNFDDIPTKDMTLYASWNNGSNPGGDYYDPITGNRIPQLGDYIIIGSFNQLWGNDITHITVTPQSGKSPGEVTVYYDGSTVLPAGVGKYRVTFNVAAADGWNEANDFFVGTLVITLNSGQLASFLTTPPRASSPSDPIIIPLSVNYDYEILEIASAIKESGTYVSLDLSGSTITEIPNEAFYNEDSDFNLIPYPYLVGITIPDGVTSIGAGAFSGCTNLKSITIPNSVTDMYGGVFHLCPNLKSVTIGNKVKKIDFYAFSCCYNLTNINIPNSVTSIEEGAFQQCTSLTSVTIGSGVKSIGYMAFYSCERLTDVTIPNSVQSIGANAFSDCTSLSSVTIGSGVSSIGMSAFSGCEELQSITIGSGVQSIGAYAFDGCDSLTTVTFEDGGNKISEEDFDAFAFPGDLKDVYVNGGGPGTYIYYSANYTWEKISP